MQKTRIKLLAILALSAGVAFFGLRIDHFKTSAESDAIVTQITKYKTWTRLNKKPIRVDFASLLKNDPKVAPNTFIIDGQEVVNFRAGDLGG